MFKGVLFDLDGVLTDTAEYHYLAWKKLGQEIGISIDRSFNQQLKGLSREDSLKKILDYGGKATSFPPEELAQLATQKNEYYLTLIQALSASDVYPGILELLQVLKAQKIRLALASASKNAPALLTRLKLQTYFDGVADPSQVKAGKPAPDIFYLAAQTIELSPVCCIGIEDAAAGLSAITKSGACPIGVGTTADLGTQYPLVDSTKELTFDFLIRCWQEHLSA